MVRDGTQGKRVCVGGAAGFTDRGGAKAKVQEAWEPGKAGSPIPP